MLPATLLIAGAAIPMIRDIGERGLTVVASAWLLAACTFDGRVIERDSGRPIEGVTVVAVWRGQALPHSGSDCYHMKTAVSDAAGEFSILSFSFNFNLMIHDRRMGLEGIYKRGYRVVERRGPKMEIVVMESLASGPTAPASRVFDKLPADCPRDVSAPLAPIHIEQDRELLDLAEPGAALSRDANKSSPAMGE